MEHPEITAAVIMDVDRLLAEGRDCQTIASQIGITEYVVSVVANDKLGKGRQPRPDKSNYRVECSQQGIDSANIRMIQRMLQIGILNQQQIAREAGVSRRVVEDVVAGKRLPVSTERPFAFKDLGERFLEKPRRCWGCGAPLSIVPCRTCRARREQSSTQFSCSG